MPSTAVGRAAYRLPLIILISIATLGVTPILRAQGSMSPFNGASSGGDYKDPAQKAADAYSRGMKAKRQAEEEKDPKAQRKLLTVDEVRHGNVRATLLYRDSMLQSATIGEELVADLVGVAVGHHEPVEAVLNGELRGAVEQVALDRLP